MNLLFPESIANRSAGIQLVYLMFIMLIGFSFAQLFGLGVFLLAGIDISVIQNMDWEKANTQQINVYKVAQVVSSLFMFIIPSYLYSLAQTGDIRFVGFRRSVEPILAILTAVLVLVALPVLLEVMSFNQSLELPEWLSPLERLIRQAEMESAELTSSILKMNNIFDLLINLLMIAVLPAIGEEMLFRGCMQPVLQRYTRSLDWGIWLTAIIFSALHFQFYGFVPRMLLGAMFGYLYFWSNNLWYPIIGHFVNNGLQVLLVYSGLTSANDIDTSEQQIPLLFVIISGVMTATILFQYRLRATSSVN